MSSSIFFKFKNSKDAVQINFDGTSLSVFEVKREIMLISRFGDGRDFDLDIYAADTNEIYDDDTTQIPRSTTVLARRSPAQRPGHGRAARYVTGHMPVNARNQHRVEANARGATGRNPPVTDGGMGGGREMTEEEKLHAIMNASSVQNKADRGSSASHKPMTRNTYGKSNAVPDKPLPQGYICHRCGQPGHWIQACPTNNDPTYNDRPRPKRTTGIPRSMLEVVEKPEDGMLEKGVMYDGNGGWVRAKPDEAAWQKFQEQQKVVAEKIKEVAKGDQELRDRGLECTIDNRPFNDPVKTPCCGKTYCRDCIENTLLDNDLLCPGCGEQVLLDNLETDDEMSKKLADFETERSAAEKARRTEQAAKSPVNTNSPGKSPLPDIKVESPGSSNSKKRAAEDELENKRRPSNPAEMKRPLSHNGTPIPTGPKAAAAAQPPRAPKSMTDFVSQMNAMASSMPGAQGGMNAFANPMMMPNMGMGMPMGMNMGMGMGMGVMPPMMGGGMPNFPMMNGMGGFGPGMGGMPQQPWMGNGMGGNGMGNGMGPQQGNVGGDDGAYMRQPVNPHRHQAKQNRRQRSVDYKQM